MTDKKQNNVRWDLSDLYASIDDPQIDKDIDTLVKGYANFAKTYKGNLKSKLGEAMAELRKLSQVSSPLFAFLFFKLSENTADQKVQQKMAQAQEAMAAANAEHMIFFDHEIVAMSEADYQKALQHKDAKHHMSMLNRIREEGKYLLSEDIEQALTMRAPYGAGEWSDFVEELEADAVFTIGGEDKTLTEALNILSNDPSSEKRFEAMEEINKGLKKQLSKATARGLNAVMGAKNVDDKQRGYASPMSARNLGNMVSDDVVKALHDAVSDTGAKYAQRYYKLLAKWMGKKNLLWSDRNARAFEVKGSEVSWDNAVDTVEKAYRSFSPQMADLFKRMIDNKWVDVPAAKGKRGGAYNYSIETANGPRSYMFLNFQNTLRDVATLAHEGGHGIHGLLAGEVQGGLQMQAPMAYAETASIFGEMITFNHLRGHCQSDHEELNLLMTKCADFLNSVNRQISFSNFEQLCFAQREKGKLTVEDFNANWRQVTEDMYGKDGEIFSYEHIDYLWSYVSHFFRPFYVYAYAFGELLTQSLYAQKDNVKDFEEKYIELLRAGNTKDAVELLKPFGLDPTDPAFWRSGIEASIGQWLKDAEVLSDKLSYKAA